MRIRLIGSLILAWWLSGCAMVDSKVLDRHEGFTCDSSAGAYFLPKTTLLVEVTETLDDVDPSAGGTPSATQKRKNYFLSLNYRRIPDQRFGFCLDYLARATSDDVINIKKHKDSNLLGLVSTDSIDKSRYIAQTLIRSAFIVASGDPEFGKGFGRNFADGPKATRTVTVFKGELDPFDPRRTAEINQALKDYGYCLIMPTSTFNRNATNINTYCEQPRQTLHRAGAPDMDYRHKSSDGLVERGQQRGQGGIFYRPRVPHAVHAYIKDNLKVPHWRLAISRVINMENVSPVIAVGVDRTMFARRKTTLVFSEGHLDHVCISKGSELLEASYIPLQIAQSVVALPASIVQVKIDTAKKSTSLLKAEKELLRTQTEHLKFLEDVERNPSTATVPKADDTNKITTKGVAPDEYNRLAANEAYAKRGKADDACPSPDQPALATGLSYQSILAPPSATNPNSN